MLDVTLLTGDCRQVMARELAGRRFDLVFADPPFNIGQDYAGFDDKIACLHGPDALVETYLTNARRLGMRRIA